MPAEYYFSIDPLLTGQAAGVASSYISTAKANTMTISCYFTGGGGAVTYFYPSPFNGGANSLISGDVPFFTQQMSGSGFQTPFTLTSAIAGIKASGQGTGNFWVAVTRRS